MLFADVYKVLGAPADADRALTKFDTLKLGIVSRETGPQPPQSFSDGAVVITRPCKARIDNAAHKDHEQFESVWDDLVYNFE